MQGCKLASRLSQRGLAIVEFAIALPFMLLLLLAIAEFGRMLYQYNSLLQANRDAVRYVAGQALSSTLGKVVIDSDLESKTQFVAVFGVPAEPSIVGGDKMSVEERKKALENEKTVKGLEVSDVEVDPIGDFHVRVTIRYVFRPAIGDGLPALIGSATPLGFELVATSVMRGL